MPQLRRTGDDSEGAESNERRGVKHRIFPVHYAPGKKLFHVIVQLSDSPGSYSLILDRIRARVNLIGTSTYTLSDGTAVFSGFAEGLSGSETGEEIRKLILESKGAIDAEVRGGKDGLLVDTFHTGFTVDGDDYVLLRSMGMSHMFDRVSRMLGSGGEALIYEEGRAMGQWNAENLAKRIGIGLVKAQIGVLSRILSAQGLGEIEGDLGPSDGAFTMTVQGCFECSGGGSPRTGCSFMRGYFAGAAEAIFGEKFKSEEPKCVFRGARQCQFRLSPSS